MPGRSGDPPSEDQAVPTHGAHAGIAATPSEAVRPDRQALFQVTRGEGQVLAFVEHRLVAQPQLDRIDAQLDRKLVDRRFQGIESRRGA